MVFYRYHSLTTGSVANGASKGDSWKSDAKYVLERVWIVERAAGALNNVQFYADVDGVPLSRPDMPAEALEPDKPQKADLNLAFAEGSSFNYKITNNSGGAQTYDIILVLATEAWPPA